MGHTHSRREKWTCFHSNEADNEPWGRQHTTCRRKKKQITWCRSIKFLDWTPQKFHYPKQCESIDADGRRLEETLSTTGRAGASTRQEHVPEPGDGRPCIHFQKLRCRISQYVGTSTSSTPRQDVAVKEPDLTAFMDNHQRQPRWNGRSHDRANGTSKNT